VNEWISVKDRLPEYGSKVLAYGIADRDCPEPQLEVRTCEYTEWDYTDRGGKKGYSFGLLSSGCGCCDGVLEDATHWMPLPEPPK